MSIDHIDRNMYNNHADNLRWATRDVQIANRRNPIPKSKPVKQLKVDGSICNFDSVKDASCKTGFSEWQIRGWIRRDHTPTDKSIWDWNILTIENEIWMPIMLNENTTGY